ncbi:hypothetical protein PU02_0834 [Bartonella ancashensis]|uniref:Uncharacterized protein n=1 Tax=Bartonella ancashensis TaxID=1318743 RepID=A0A0M5KX12_9HYPH|nr:hypothetical protein PU02_0834 [Bartonella ancashensis]
MCTQKKLVCWMVNKGIWQLRFRKFFEANPFLMIVITYRV